MKIKNILSAGLLLCLGAQALNAQVTYHIYATREGLVGNHTANGHLIVSRDHFCALPSGTVLNSNGGTTYTVNLSNPANGRTKANVPVWDVGPWNTTDNYWHTPRAAWTDLARGLPEAQAAYQNGYNGGKDQFGRIVGNPAGIDLADGTFWDDMGMTGNGWIDVTFNWETPVNNAAVVSSSQPSSVAPGQSFSATVTMNNNGSSSWISANGYNLGSQNPQDNTRWGMGRVAVAGTIAPGQNCAFTFNCTAPGTVGSYPFDWQMVQDGVSWFGTTSTASINVAAALPNIIVDNNTSGFAASANWTTGSSSTDKYGADYRYRSTASVSDQATWTGNLPSAGSYKVYAWWTQGANRTASVGYTVYHSTGSTVVNVNQQAGGGIWNQLGTFSLNGGNNQVKLSCWTTTGFVVVGDAVRWQKQ
jgi:hypothetical protein